MECGLESTTVHYEVFGEGKPFLMLHGGLGDHTYWSLALEPLFEQRTGWQRIYPDLPGHGRTAASEGISTVDELFDVVLDFVDHVIPGQHLAVVGFSLGAYLAQRLSHHRPSEVEGCLLIGPPSLHTTTEWVIPERLVAVRDETLLTDLGEGIEADRLRDLYEYLLVVQNRTHLERARHLILPALAIPDDGWEERASWAFTWKVEEPAQPFAKPVLMLLGRQDSNVGYRGQMQEIEAYLHATLAVLDLAGHGLAGVEQVEVCQVLIHEWLDRVERIWSI